jgi:hypothetical protein
MTYYLPPILNAEDVVLKHTFIGLFVRRGNVAEDQSENVFCIKSMKIGCDDTFNRELI